MAFELMRVNNNPCDNASRNLAWPAAAAPVDVRFIGPAEFQDLARTAKERWNENVRIFRFGSGAGSACDLDDGIVSVSIANADCSGQGLDDALAVTTSRWFSDGRLADADIIVNASSVASTNQDLFLEIVMHELGHVLGLDHSDACGNSGAGTLMRSVIVLSQPRLDRPQADDIAGANFIYPGASGTVPEGANSCALIPPRRSSEILVLLLPFIFFFLVRCYLQRSAPIGNRRSSL